MHTTISQSFSLSLHLSTSLFLSLSPISHSVFTLCVRIMLITALHYHHLSIRIRMCSVHYLFNQFEWGSRGQRRWRRKESSSRSVAFPQFHISLKFTPFSLSLSLPSLSLLAYLVGLSSFWHFGKDQKSNVSNSPTHTRCDTHTHRDCTHTHTQTIHNKQLKLR